MKAVWRMSGLATSLPLLLAAALSAQQADVRARLEARGLPTELVEQVSALAANAAAQGLPAEALADKAIEGYAKQVPAARIVAALRDYGSRMAGGRDALRDAGIEAPSGPVITAAADAIGRGLQPNHVGLVARAAPNVELVSPGLTVVAALTAQGMPTSRAVDVVTAAMQRGRSSSQILDLPSTAQAWQQRGLTPDQAGERLLRGGGPGPGPGGGPGGPGVDGNRGGMDGRPPRQGADGRGTPGGPAPPPPRPPRPGEGRPGGDRPTQP